MQLTDLNAEGGIGANCSDYSLLLKEMKSASLRLIASPLRMFGDISSIVSQTATETIL